MAAIYDALGNYMGDDGAPDPGALTSPSVAPIAGTAPLAGTAPMPAPVTPAVPPMPPPALEQPTDVMSYKLPDGVLGPSTYAEPMMGEGVLMAASAPEGALMQPQQDNGIFSFLNKPGASDSLVAFGSAMLRAPTFGEGLANAADAVTQVAQQYREPTPREIAIARMKGQIAKAARGDTDVNGYEWDLKNRIVGNDGKTYYPGTGPDGMPAFYNIDTKEVVRNVQGGTSDVYSATAQQNRALGVDRGKDLSRVETEVQSADSKISQYDTLLAEIDTAGVGTSVWTQVTGRLAELSGYDVFGIDLSDRGVAQQQIATMNVAASQALRGQGQVTEFERKLLADTLPQMTSDPAAAKRVIEILKKAEQRKIEQYIEYNRRISAGEQIPWTMFVLEYRQRLDQRNAQGSPQSGGTNNSSIFDEADAIVNGN